MKGIRGVVVLQTIVFLIALLIPCIVSAERCDKWVAKVVSVQGTAEAQRSGETLWNPVKFRDTYCAGDKIRVMEKSRAVVSLFNDATLHLDQNTTVTLVGPEEEQTMLIELLNGAAYFFSRFPRSLKVITPFINAGVEGTEFFINVDKDKASMSVFKGKVSGTSKEGSITLTSGESAVAEKGKAPKSYVLTKPRDQVQWTLYYQPVMYEHPETIKENDPRFYIYRASSLLRVGRIDEAKADIEKAMKLDPNNSMALATQSIIAVAQNDKDKALELAGKAVQADPKSASAQVALSYAKQADFDLNGALSSLKEAVRVEPENALAWARLSEIWLSFGELDEALKAANKAVELNPGVARTQTVLGFAYLTQVKITESKEVFEKAIELDQADPLPRLGLGLAKIREGCLKEGRQEIEIAAALDTGNSLIRSYLGKSYYEEKRDKQAGEEFSIAEELDPQDPTPFFYNAIRKQSVNRPVEALQDMEKAIELNDDRAVYRSKLLLDSDLAARSASLARIYSDLGFQDLALVEGWKSVNTDPADFSAHRFLADSYSVLPRHEIARVSELLQAQLLQPLNITPLQPSLSESNLGILSGAGPSDLSFNEFNPLFNRNRYSLQLSSIVGENGTFGDEMVASAVHGKVSISAGQFHYETDGWRKNNDQKQDIYNLFAQVEFSPSTSIQAEFRSKDWKRGDLTLRYFPDDFLPQLRMKDEINSVRFGFRHSFSPSSSLIGSLMYHDAQFNFHTPIPGGGFGVDTDSDSYSGEFQYLSKAESISVITGGGYFKVDRTEVFSTEIIDPPISMSDTTDTDVRHSNVYVYANIYYPKNVTLTVGTSADLFQGEIEDRNQVNPKFGVIWNLLQDTTLRAAAFRTLKRTLINDQTLEPTQVAGFNQFFDDSEATRAWRYGIAVDQKFTKGLYGGAEYSQRDYDEPSSVIPDPPAPPVPQVERVDFRERLGRVYLYWTPHKWWSFSIEYQYERLDRDKSDFLNNPEYLKTQRFPVGIAFFHPVGFSAQLKATYFDQKGEFITNVSEAGSQAVSDSDQFWVVDAAISYRFPKRFGLVTFGAKNLFDESFRYYDTDPENPILQPKRMIFGKLTMVF